MTKVRSLPSSKPGSNQQTGGADAESSTAACRSAFDFFNRALFDGAVQECFFTYQRKANSVGYFSPDRFSGRIDNLGRHELALNPDAFTAQTDEQVLQTLVHEMTHAMATPLRHAIRRAAITTKNGRRR